MTEDTRDSRFTRSTWGFPRRDNALLAHLLREAGMTDPDIAAWCDSLVPGDSAAVAALAQEWATEQVPAGVATAFCTIGEFTAREGAAFHFAGFSASQAKFAETLVRWNHFSFDLAETEAPEVSPLVDWLLSGLTPQWICLCLAAGVPNFLRGMELRAANQEDSLVACSLEVESMTRGVNVRQLKIQRSAT